MAFPTGIVGGLAGPLLEAWQGHEFPEVAPVLSVSALLLGLSICYQPLASVFLATDRMRIPAFIQLATGLVAVTCGYALAKWTALGLLGPAISTAGWLALRSCIFTPVYAARILGLPWTTFFRQGLAATIPSLVIAASAMGLARLFGVHGWTGILTISTILAATYAASIWPLLRDSTVARDVES